ncbi:MAG: TetR/AcrR family transcriptional regulator [Solirubrobacteraceae bacterium]
MFYTIDMPPSSREPRKVARSSTQAAGVASAALPPPPRRVSSRPKATPRRTGLSVEAIVDAAIEVLDESGVAGLSMRRVADRLGTGAASLYAYVSGRDELLELVFDELIGRVPLPEPDPERWREQIHESLGELLEILASHRDAALAGLGRIPTSPKALAGAEALTAVLRAGGLSDQAVALGLDQLLLYVCACAFERGLFAHSGMNQVEVDEYFADIDRFYAALPAERFPVLASIGEEMATYDAQARFTFGLDVLLAGLEAVDRRSRRAR